MRFLQIVIPFVVCCTLNSAALADAKPAAPVPAESERPWGGGGPYKLAAADFTGDGILDLAIAYVQSGLLSIQQGDGKGNFSNVHLIVAADASPSQPQEVHNIAQGDIDNDGLPDLIYGIGGSPPSGWREQKLPIETLRAGWSGKIVVAKNLGKGAFKIIMSEPLASAGKGVALADLDKDGKLDLIYTARGSGYEGDLKLGRLFIRQNLGDWKFAPAIESDAGHSAYYVETGDLNNDGFLDILVPNEHGMTVQIWMNPGKEIFSKPDKIVHRTIEASQIAGPHALNGRTAPAINDVRAADFNGDGKLDLVTANLGTNTISVFPGNGDGTFQKDTVFDSGGYGAFYAVGDLNKDGHPDFAIAHWREQDFVSVFLNKGDGTFLPSKDYKTAIGNYGVIFCDYDGDKNLDMISANYVDRSISVLKGNGDGTFAPAVTTKKEIQLVSGKWMPK